jgi:hypothetical protein
VGRPLWMSQAVLEAKVVVVAVVVMVVGKTSIGSSTALGNSFNLDRHWDALQGIRQTQQLPEEPHNHTM